MGTQLPGLHTASQDARHPLAPSDYTPVGAERHSALCTQIINSLTCYWKCSFWVHVYTNQCQMPFGTRARTWGQLNHSTVPPYAGSCKAGSSTARLLAQHLPLLPVASLPTAPSTVCSLQAEGTRGSEHQCPGRRPGPCTLTSPCLPSSLTWRYTDKTFPVSARRKDNLHVFGF